MCQTIHPFPLTLINARHTPPNSLASLFRLQQKSTSRIPKLPALNLHSTLSPASLQVKCINPSSRQSNNHQQRSPHHTQTYLSLFFSHPYSLPPFLHFQFHSAVAAAYQRISRLQLPHTFIPISFIDFAHRQHTFIPLYSPHFYNCHVYKLL